MIVQYSVVAATNGDGNIYENVRHCNDDNEYATVNDNDNEFDTDKTAAMTPQHHYANVTRRDMLVERLFRTKMLQREKRRQDRRKSIAPYNSSTSRRMVRFDTTCENDRDDDYYDLDDFDNKSSSISLSTHCRDNDDNNHRRRRLIWCVTASAIVGSVLLLITDAITISIVATTRNDSGDRSLSSSTTPPLSKIDKMTLSQRCNLYANSNWWNDRGNSGGDTSAAVDQIDKEDRCSSYDLEQSLLYDILFDLRDILMSAQQVVLHNDDLSLIQKTLNLTEYLITSRIFHSIGLTGGKEKER